MKDVLGREIRVGDTLIRGVGRYGALRKMSVSAVNPHTDSIEVEQYRAPIKRTLWGKVQVAIVDRIQKYPPLSFAEEK